MELGYESRAVGGHSLNARSSRSHLVLTVHATVTAAADGARTRGKLHLIDLAGR